MDTIPEQRIMINSHKMPKIKNQKVSPWDRGKERSSDRVGKLWNNCFSSQLKILLPKPHILGLELFELKNLWVLFPSIFFCKRE